MFTENQVCKWSGACEFFHFKVLLNEILLFPVAQVTIRHHLLINKL